MAQSRPTPQDQVDQMTVHQWLGEIRNEDTRGNALHHLSMRREMIPHLGSLLWDSFGVISVLMKEITSSYTLLNPVLITDDEVYRICCINFLLQSLAGDNETKSKVLDAAIPQYLYPFLRMNSQIRPIEYIRLSALGVFGAMVVGGDPKAVDNLVRTEFLPICLKLAENGSEENRILSTFILQKILLDEAGLNYICVHPDRLSNVVKTLKNVILYLVHAPSIRVLRYVVRCYLRLTDNGRAREALRQCLPIQLKDRTFYDTCKNDITTIDWLSKLRLIIDPSSFPTRTQWHYTK